jgi:hypothetical protein
VSAPGGQGHEGPFGVPAAGDFHCGRCGTLLDGGTDEPVAARDLRAEVECLRSALQEITKWAEAARGHYGIEECSGPGRPRTEWDEIQDGLRAAALSAREALSGPAPNEDRG